MARGPVRSRAAGWRMHALLTPADAARLNLPSRTIFVDERTFNPDRKQSRRR